MVCLNCLSTPRAGLSLAERRELGQKKIKTVDRVINGFIIGTIALIVATGVLIGLAQARMIHPIASLYPFGAIIPMIIFIKVFDVCRNRVAENHDIRLRELNNNNANREERRSSQ